jgi:hypothetical protein
MTADRDDCGQLDHPQACRTGGGQPLMICTAAFGLKGATRRCAMAHAAIVCGERARGWVCHGMEGVAQRFPRQIWQSSSSLAPIGLHCGAAPLYAEDFLLRKFAHLDPRLRRPKNVSHLIDAAGRPPLD